MAYAYYFAGDREAGIRAARAYARAEFSLDGNTNPDIVLFRYGLFSVDDARRVITLANQAALSDQKLVIIAAERLFHEAQNALLKVFEEPPVGTTLVLVVPSAGIILSTLRSRMGALETAGNDGLPRSIISAETRAFIDGSTAEREKLVAKLLDRAKSDKDEEKQAARGEALRLTEGLATAAYMSWQKKEREEVKLFMRDLEHFIPILHERSAPLKSIFEHLLITVPKF